MNNLATIESAVAWIARETRRCRSRAKARELLGRLRFEQRQLQRIADEFESSTLEPKPA